MARGIPPKTIAKASTKGVSLKSNNHRKAGTARSNADSSTEIASAGPKQSFGDRMFLAEAAYNRNFKKAFKSPGGGVAGSSKQKIDYSTGIGSPKGPEAVSPSTKSDWDEADAEPPAKFDPEDLSDK